MDNFYALIGADCCTLLQIGADPRRSAACKGRKRFLSCVSFCEQVEPLRARSQLTHAWG